jgi:hypothetical protein
LRRRLKLLEQRVLRKTVKLLLLRSRLRPPPNRLSVRSPLPQRSSLQKHRRLRLERRER